MSGSKYIIYGLCDPRTKEVRYVGKSCKGMDRPKEHFYSFQRKTKSPKNSWIINLLKQNITAEIIIIENCKKENLDEREIYWINSYRNMGHKLTNMTDGGTGGDTGGAYKKHKPVTAIEISTGKKIFYDYVWQAEKDGFKATKVVAVCKKRRASHMGYYFHYSNEEFETPIKKTMQPILCKCKKTGEETFFHSIGEASKHTGYCITSISNISRGKQNCRKYEFLNASHVNERYQPGNPVIRIEL